jgi:hypothetical protein
MNTPLNASYFVLSFVSFLLTPLLPTSAVVTTTAPCQKLHAHTVPVIAPHMNNSIITVTVAKIGNQAYSPFFDSPGSKDSMTRSGQRNLPADGMQISNILHISFFTHIIGNWAKKFNRTASVLSTNCLQVVPGQLRLTNSKTILLD